MYNVKPILTDQHIELPTCMYVLKPHNTDLIGNMEESDNSGKSEIELLEEKQNRILKKLDDLKRTLMSMRGDIKLCNKPAQPCHQQVKSLSRKPIEVSALEVVINVHPTNVPFSILALKTLWRGQLNMQVDVFTHSTVKESDFTKAARDFAAKVAAPIVPGDLPILKVTIIWKDVETTQMLTSPVSIPVYGEVNIIRFLNRVGPSEFWYEADNHFANLSDTILDICYQLSKKHSPKERATYCQLLSQRLGKSQFYNDSPSLSIADVAVSSILKKLFANNLKELPANLSSWLQKVSSVAGY